MCNCEIIRLEPRTWFDKFEEWSGMDFWILENMVELIGLLVLWLVFVRGTMEVWGIFTRR